MPLADYVVDRWERAREYGFGEGSSVYDSCLVLGEVSVGTNTWIGPFTVLDGSGGLTIGDGCAISAGVQIYTHDTVANIISGGAAVVERTSTRIGSRVYIGPQTVLARGVVVGDGAVVGAHSFVDRDVPAHARVWGRPARPASEQSTPPAEPPAPQTLPPQS